MSLSLMDSLKGKYSSTTLLLIILCGNFLWSAFGSDIHGQTLFTTQTPFILSQTSLKAQDQKINLRPAP